MLIIYFSEKWNKITNKANICIRTSFFSMSSYSLLLLLLLIRFIINFADYIKYLQKMSILLFSSYLQKYFILLSLNSMKAPTSKLRQYKTWQKIYNIYSTFFFFNCLIFLGPSSFFFFCFVFSIYKHNE